MAWPGLLDHWEKTGPDFWHLEVRSQDLYFSACLGAQPVFSSFPKSEEPELMSELKLTQPTGWAQPPRGSVSHLRPPAILLVLWRVHRFSQAESGAGSNSSALEPCKAFVLRSVCRRQINTPGILMRVFSFFSLILLPGHRAEPRADPNCPSCLHREEESHRSNTSTPAKSDKELQTEKGKCSCAPMLHPGHQCKQESRTGGS